MLDASVALARAFEDEADGYADAALDALAEHGAVVPSLWGREVVNALVAGERRGRITPADSARFLSLLGDLPIETEDLRLDELTELALPARERRLSAYDASYLSVAMRRGLSIVTQDARLRDAASGSGVVLFSP